MSKPAAPVSLTAEQIQDLNQKLSTMRHDINNHLSLIQAAMGLIQHKPQMAERMFATLGEQPPKIGAAIAAFSAEFEDALGLKRS